MLAGPVSFIFSLFCYGLVHREVRVLGLFSSRPNWDSPTPSPAGECVPPSFASGGGGGGVGGGGGKNDAGDGNLVGYLYTHVICASEETLAFPVRL